MNLPVLSMSCIIRIRHHRTWNPAPLRLSYFRLDFSRFPCLLRFDHGRFVRRNVAIPGEVAVFFVGNGELRKQLQKQSFKRLCIVNVRFICFIQMYGRWFDHNSLLKACSLERNWKQGQSCLEIMITATNMREHETKQTGTTNERMGLESRWEERERSRQRGRERKEWKRERVKERNIEKIERHKKRERKRYTQTDRQKEREGERVSGREREGERENHQILTYRRLIFLIASYLFPLAIALCNRRYNSVIFILIIRSVRRDITAGLPSHF